MLLIKNGNIMTMTKRGSFTGDVLIDGKKIAKLGGGISADGARVIDARGMTVMPGFVEAHCHAGLSLEKQGTPGDDCNETTDPVTPYIRARDAVDPMDDAFMDAASAGITTVMTGPGSSNVVGGTFLVMKIGRRVLRDAVIKDPAAMKIAFGENPKTAYGNVMPGSRMGIGWLLRRELMRARDYMEKREKKAVGPDYTLEPYLPVLRREIPLKAHVHRASDILLAIDIADEFGLDLTLDHCTEGHLVAEEIAESGFPAIVGPSLASRSKIEVAQSDFKTAGILERAGVPVAICTDHPVSVLKYLPVCAGLAMREGMSRSGALAAVTSAAAGILGIAGRTGSLAEGMDADIAVIDGDPLALSALCMYTVSDGEVIFSRDGSA